MDADGMDFIMLAARNGHCARIFSGMSAKSLSFCFVFQLLA
jgi:hypothetical protein